MYCTEKPHNCASSVSQPGCLFSLQLTKTTSSNAKCEAKVAKTNCPQFWPQKELYQTSQIGQKIQTKENLASKNKGRYFRYKNNLIRLPWSGPKIEIKEYYYQRILGKKKHTTIDRSSLRFSDLLIRGKPKSENRKVKNENLTI